MSCCPNNSEYERQVPHSELCHEAQKGNIDYLRAIHRHLGYVQYDQCIAQAALNNGQYEFWREFVLLSKGTLPSENYPWDARVQVISDLLMGFRGPEHYLYDLYRSLYDTFLLHTSLKDTNINDMADRHLGSELEADLCVALALHPPQRLIIDYMVIEKGFQFKVQHLELAQLTFDRELVHYVRQHLSPDVDGDDDPEPNDCDLACLVIDAVHYQRSDGVGASGDDAPVVQFLLDYPQMIDKMYFLIDYLQSLVDFHANPGGILIADFDKVLSDSSDEDSDCDQDTRHPVYPTDVAAQLLAGIVDLEDGGMSPRPCIVELPLVVLTPSLLDPTELQPTWVETQLLRARSDLPTFIEDVMFMCQLIFTRINESPAELQRWDLVIRSQPGPCRELFQPNSVPSRLQLLSRRRDWFNELLSQLIRKENYNSIPEPGGSSSPS